MQDKVQKGELSIVKVRGEDHAADGLTKHVGRSKLDKYMKDCGFTFRDGRHELCPHLGDVFSSLVLEFLELYFVGLIGSPFPVRAAIAHS